MNIKNKKYKNVRMSGHVRRAWAFDWRLMEHAQRVRDHRAARRPLCLLLFTLNAAAAADLPLLGLQTEQRSQQELYHLLSQTAETYFRQRAVGL